MCPANAGAICFDLDGTLTDPKVGIARSIRHALAALDQPVADDDDLTWCIGPPLLGSFERMLGDRQQAETALTHYRERFGAIGLYENAVYPGIRETLDSLTDAGHRLFVATSKPWVYAERIIEHFALTSRFEAVFGAELDGTRADKTDLLAWVLDRASLDPTTTTMIGDRSHDIIGGARQRHGDRGRPLRLRHDRRSSPEPAPIGSARPQPTCYRRWTRVGHRENEPLGDVEKNASLASTVSSPAASHD